MEKKATGRGRKFMLIIALVLVLLVIDALSILLYLKPFSVSSIIPQIIPSEKFKVTEIIDGDTLKTENGYYIRLIGISAFKQPQKSFDDSKNFLSLLVLGKTIRFEKDKQDQDSYGQLLRYVYVDFYGKEIFVNAEMAKQGYALPLAVEPNTKYKSVIDEARIYCLENKLNYCNNA